MNVFFLLSLLNCEIPPGLCRYVLFYFKIPHLKCPQLDFLSVWELVSFWSHQCLLSQFLMSAVVSWSLPSEAAAGFFLLMTSLFWPMTPAFKWRPEGLCFIVAGNSSVEHLNLCLSGNTFLPPASLHYQPHGGVAAFDFIVPEMFGLHFRTAGGIGNTSSIFIYCLCFK